VGHPLHNPILISSSHQIWEYLVQDNGWHFCPTFQASVRPTFKAWRGRFLSQCRKLWRGARSSFRPLKVSVPLMILHSIGRGLITIEVTECFCSPAHYRFMWHNGTRICLLPVHHAQPCLSGHFESKCTKFELVNTLERAGLVSKSLTVSWMKKGRIVVKQLKGYSNSLSIIEATLLSIIISCTSIVRGWNTWVPTGSCSLEWRLRSLWKWWHNL
jgi:hypothetical protein